jgi:hypothetical protein
MRVAQPLTQGVIGREAFGARQHLCKTSADVRRERDGLTGRARGRQSGRYASGGRDRQPASDGVAMDPEAWGHVLAGMGLPTGQERQPLETRLLVPIMLPLQAVLALVRLCGQGWNGRAPEVPSQPG